MDRDTVLAATVAHASFALVSWIDNRGVFSLKYGLFALELLTEESTPYYSRITTDNCNCMTAII